MRKLLQAVASDRPLVVVFDDIHWGEPTFLDLVEHVADWSRDAPILLLCLARPELLELRPGWGGGKLNATTVLLEPLSAPETDELIDELLGGRALDAELRERIRDGRGGQPALRRADARDGRGVAGRRSRCRRRSRRSSRRGSTSSRPPSGPRSSGARSRDRSFTAARSRRSRPTTPTCPRVCSASCARSSSGRARRTLPDDDAFRFRHLLIRDAAYEALPKASRAELHERFAVWLEGRAPDLVELDEILGYHLEQAARYRAELGDPVSGSAGAGRGAARGGGPACGRAGGCERLRVAARAGVRPARAG